MTKKKNSKRQEYLKKVKHHIRDLKKRGLDVDNVTKGKSLEQLAWNKKTYENFLGNKKISLSKERKEKKKKKKEITSEIKGQFEKIDQYTKNILQKNYKLPHFTQYNNKNSKELKSFLNEIKNMETLEDIAIKETQAKAKEFLINRYFKEFRLEEDIQERLTKIIKSFKGNLSDFDDFTQEIISRDFKQYTDGDEYLKYESVDDYRGYMEHTLDRVEQLVKSKYSKRLSERFINKRKN